MQYSKTAQAVKGTKEAHQKKSAERWDLGPTQSTWEDTEIRCIYKNQPSEHLVVKGSIVLAGDCAKREWPALNKFPVHFKKEYFPGAGGDPEDEYNRTAKVWKDMNKLGQRSPHGLGYEEGVFRSEIINGVSWASLSPFGNKLNHIMPRDEKVLEAVERLAEQKTANVGYNWGLLEKIDKLATDMHSTFVHEDLHRNNILLEVDDDKGELTFIPVPIDFETAEWKVDMDPTDFEEWVDEDRIQLLAEACLYQMALGRQQGPLAEESWERRVELLGGEIVEKWETRSVSPLR